MSAVTLPEFLLARWAEREASARALMRRAQDHHLKVREPRLLGREIPGWHDWPDVEALCAEVLADLEAKRRIMELHGSLNGYGFRIVCVSCVDQLTGAGDNQILFPCPTLRLLALPFAGHEDYQPEWKP